MASYTQFLTDRVTLPDPALLVAALRAVEASAGVASRLQVPGIVTVKTTAVLTGSQLTAMQTAIDTSAAMSPQALAQAEIDRWPIAMKALVLALIDQLNVIRAAGNAPLPPITPAQALAAIRAKAGTL